MVFFTYLCPKFESLIKNTNIMKKFLSIWFNRVSGVFYLGIFLIFMMLFCNPYVNVVLLLVALAVLLGGGAYVNEKLKHTEGEEILLQKFDKFLNYLCSIK